MSTTVIIAEAREGKVKRPSLEAVTAGLDLAAASGGGEVVVIVTGSELDAANRELAASGAAKVIAIDSPVLSRYSGDGFARVILEQLAKLSPVAILAPHTAMGRDLVPRIAAKLGVGLMVDVTALHFEDGRYGATRPVYAGKAYRKLFATKAPFIATLRPNNWEPENGAAEAEITEVVPQISVEDLKAVVEEVVAAATDRVPLQEARVVVAGGRGLKEPDHFRLIEELVEAFGPGVASVGASRAVVDAGWRPHREQVGQTGKVVSPTLYIAVGISGAIQHLAGMRTARYIVAINKDSNAPIFKVADYGIVGDAFEVVPALTEAIKSAVAS
jgi:electron transfer flavoprotein alpha subunit